MSNTSQTHEIPARGASDPASPVRRYGAKALIQAGSRVLLVQERHADGSVFWTLPGGGVQPSESRCEGLRRELSEELGCHSIVDHQCAVFQYVHHSQEEIVSTYAVFKAWLLSKPVPNHREGIDECRWTSPAAPPSKTLPGVVSVLDNVNGQ
jgi:8-oxo-dGTP pyrophosphatase MutT (NUDIX family)